MKNLILKGLRHLRQLRVSSRFSSLACGLVGHKPSDDFKCCRCKKVLYEFPKVIEKKIEIIVKDKYDEMFGSMLEYGIVTPFEYYKTKKFVIENGLMS